MQASCVSVLFTIRTSLTPTRPSSVVSSRNSSSRQGVPTIVVRASRIFTRQRYPPSLANSNSSFRLRTLTATLRFHLRAPRYGGQVGGQVGVTGLSHENL